MLVWRACWVSRALSSDVKAFMCEWPSCEKWNVDGVRMGWMECSRKWGLRYLNSQVLSLPSVLQHAPETWWSLGSSWRSVSRIRRMHACMGVKYIEQARCAFERFSFPDEKLCSWTWVFFCTPLVVWVSVLPLACMRWVSNDLNVHFLMDSLNGRIWTRQLANSWITTCCVVRVVCFGVSTIAM